MRKIKHIFMIAVLTVMAFTVILIGGCKGCNGCNGCNKNKEAGIEFVDFEDITVSAELGDLFDYSQYLNAVDTEGNSYDIKASVTDSTGEDVQCLKNEFEVLDKNGYLIEIFAVDDVGSTLQARNITIDIVKQEGPVVGHIRYACDGKEVNTLCVLKNYTFLSRIEDVTGEVSYTATVYPLVKNGEEITRGEGKAIDVTTHTFFVNEEGDYELEIVATDGVNETKRSSFFTATSAINLISFYHNDEAVTEFSFDKTYTYQSLLNETDGDFTYEATLTPVSVVYNSTSKNYEKTTLEPTALTTNSFSLDEPREYLFKLHISDGKGKEAYCEKILYCVSTEKTDDTNYILVEDFVESGTAACSYTYKDGKKDKTAMNPTSIWHEKVTDENGVSRYGVISTQSTGDTVNSFQIRSSWMTSAYGKEWWESDKWDYFSFWVYIPSESAGAESVTLAFRGKQSFGRPDPLEVECDVWTEIVWTKQQLGAVMGAEDKYPQGYPYFVLAYDRNNNFNPLFVLEADAENSTQKRDTVVYIDSLAYMKSPALNISDTLYVGTNTGIEASLEGVDDDISVVVKDGSGQVVTPTGGEYAFDTVGEYTVLATAEYAGMTFRLNKTVSVIEPTVQITLVDADGEEITSANVGDTVRIKASVDGVSDGYEFTYDVQLNGSTFSTNRTFTPNASGEYAVTVSVEINGVTFNGTATVSASFENMTFTVAENGVTGTEYPLSAEIKDKTTGETANVTFTYQWLKGDSGWITLANDKFTPVLGAGVYTLRATATYDNVNYEKTSEITVIYQSNMLEDFAAEATKSTMSVVNNGSVDRTQTNTTAQYHTVFAGRYGVVSAKPVSDGATNKIGNDYQIFPITPTIYASSALQNLVAGQEPQTGNWGSDRTTYRRLWYTNTDWDYLSVWIYIDDEAENSTLQTIDVMARYGTEKQAVPLNQWYEFKISKYTIFSSYTADFETIFTGNYGLIQLVRATTETQATAGIEKTKECRVYFDSVSLEKYENEQDFTKAYITEYGSVEQVTQLQDGVKYQLHFFVGETEIDYDEITVVNQSGAITGWSATDFTFTFADTTSSDNRFRGEFTYTDASDNLYRAFVGATE